MRKQNKVAFFNILSTLLLRGLSIITAPLFSRMLGPDGYGIVSIYNVWMGALQIVFTLNTFSTIVNARVEYPEEQQDAYHSAILGLSLAAFTVFATLVLIFLEPVAKLMKLPQLVVGLMMVHVLAAFFINFIHTKFTYEYRSDLNCFLSVLVAVLVLVLSVLLIRWVGPEFDYYGRILALVITNVLVGFPAAIYVLSKGKTLYNREYWVFCLSLCLPLVFYNLSDLILGYTDRLMLQQMMSETMVGQYSLASVFGNIMFTIFTALNNSWVPFFFEDYKKGDRERVHGQAKNYLELFTVLSIGFVLLTQEIYHVFASREYWMGTALVPFFVMGFYFNFLCTFPVNIEYYHKKNKITAVVTILAAVVNIGLNFLLIRRLGPLGAVISTAISHGVQLLLHYCYAHFLLEKESYPFKFPLWAGYMLVFFGAVALSLATPQLWWLRWGLGAAIGVWELLRIRRRKVLI